MEFIEGSEKYANMYAKSFINFYNKIVVQIRS